MIVCLCQRISDRDIRQAVAGGVRDFDPLPEETARARNCGCCHDCAREVFDAACSASAPRCAPAPIWLSIARPALA